MAYMYKEIIYKMRQRGIEFTTGLSDREITTIHQEYGVAFPKELEAFCSKTFVLLHK